MRVNGDYQQAGYAHLEGLMAPEIAKALLDQFWADLGAQKVPVRFTAQEKLTVRATAELHGSHYKPMATFLWGLTPTMSALSGRDLLPSYCFFRIYQKDDVLRVHSDRNACEHSLSLTLGYSDNEVWGFDVGQHELADPARIADDFGDEPFSTIAMKPGDAVLYRGITHRHARLQKNPNKWSAHLFLHWVDREGPHRAFAFEDLTEPQAR